MRPALVIQNDTGNEFASTTIVAGMTTRSDKGYPHRVTVSPSESGLRETSTVMLEQILTVDLARLKRQVGRLTPDAMTDVDRAIKYSLGLVD